MDYKNVLGERCGNEMKSLPNLHLYYPQMGVQRAATKFYLNPPPLAVSVEYSVSQKFAEEVHVLITLDEIFVMRLGDVLDILWSGSVDFLQITEREEEGEVNCPPMLELHLSHPVVQPVDILNEVGHIAENRPNPGSFGVAKFVLVEDNIHSDDQK